MKRFVREKLFGKSNRIWNSSVIFFFSSHKDESPYGVKYGVQMASIARKSLVFVKTNRFIHKKVSNYRVKLKLTRFQTTTQAFKIIIERLGGEISDIQYCVQDGVNSAIILCIISPIQLLSSKPGSELWTNKQNLTWFRKNPSWALQNDVQR